MAVTAALNITSMHAVAGRLLLTLRQAPPADAVQLELATAAGAVARAPLVRSVQVASGGLLAAELDPLAVLPLFDARFEATLLDGEGRPLARGPAVLAVVGIDAEGLSPGHRALVERAIAEGVYPPVVAAALRWRIAARNLDGRSTLHLDHGVPLGGGAVVEGWVANLGDRRLVILSDGLESARHGDEVGRFERPDISDLLAERGVTTDTDLHAFVTTLPLFRPGDRGFLLFEERGDLVEYLGRISWDGRQLGSADEALAQLGRRLGEGGFLPPARARAHLGPLLSPAPAEDPGYELVEVNRGETPPALSVVVPLFGSPVLLRGLLQNQAMFPEATEFVLVCDDPRLHGFARDYALDRRPLLARPTRLLLNRANYGFSVANNLGVREARAPVLLFQNSDVRVEDQAGLADGLDAIVAGRFGIVGFRLLFEDGTVQHDGMAFRRHRLLHDLFTAEHPGKGLPPAPLDDEAVTPAAAVTGAMLMIGRGWFDELGGFDPGYGRGDFEDGDLCLRSAAAGRPVGVARRGRIRHLERQSIVGSGPPAMRQAITHLNCIRFNERWAAALGAAA